MKTTSYNTIPYRFNKCNTINYPTTKSIKQRQSVHSKTSLLHLYKHLTVHTMDVIYLIPIFLPFAACHKHIMQCILRRFFRWKLLGNGMMTYLQQCCKRNQNLITNFYIRTLIYFKIIQEVPICNPEQPYIDSSFISNSNKHALQFTSIEAQHLKPNISQSNTKWKNKAKEYKSKINYDWYLL